MYHIKQDQRSMRSAETIYNAIVRLINRKPFDSIKVSEVVSEAQIARGTFYRNFDAIEDVLRWRCDLVVDELRAYVREYRHTKQLDYRMPVLKPVLRFFYVDSSLIELLNAAERIDIFQSVLQKKIETVTLMQNEFDIPAEYHAYISIIRSAAAVQILAHWVQNGKREAPDALADGLSMLAGQLSR